MKYIKRIVLVFSIFLIFSCSEEQSSENEVVSNQNNLQVENLYYELNRYIITGECELKSPQQFLITQEMKTFAKRRYFTDNKVFFAGEEVFNQHYGSFEALFYDPSQESADWVDSCISLVEEERIAAQLALLEDEDFIIEEEPLPEPESPVISDKPATEISGKDGQLVTSEFENEKLITQEHNGKRILIYASNGNVLRKIYDEKQRIEKEEEWEISSVDKQEVKKSTEYIYSEESGRIAKKKITENGRLEIISFVGKGLVAKKEVYQILEKENKIISSFERRYNQEEKVSSEVSTSYTYTDDTYEKLKESYEQKYEYFYNEGDIPPDFKYYEDGMLRMHNKYSVEKGSYTSQIYFDNNYSVKTYYEDSVRVREVFFIDGQVRREKLYERKKDE
ncbi:MAG: hypothetical protein K5786_00515 [Treponema sp.]|nr:hypothetical protein [Treponema sp.]